MSARDWPARNRVEEVFCELLAALIIGRSISMSPSDTDPEATICSESMVASGTGALKVSRRMREPVTTISSTATCSWAEAIAGTAKLVAATEPSSTARSAFFMGTFNLAPRPE